MSSLWQLVSSLPQTRFIESAKFVLGMPSDVYFLLPDLLCIVDSSGALTLEEILTVQKVPPQVKELSELNSFWEDTQSPLLLFRVWKLFQLPF